MWPRPSRGTRLVSLLGTVAFNDARLTVFRSDEINPINSLRNSFDEAEIRLAMTDDPKRPLHCALYIDTLPQRIVKFASVCFTGNSPKVRSASVPIYSLYMRAITVLLYTHPPSTDHFMPAFRGQIRFPARRVSAVFDKVLLPIDRIARRFRDIASIHSHVGGTTMIHRVSLRSHSIDYFSDDDDDYDHHQSWRRRSSSTFRESSSVTAIDRLLQRRHRSRVISVFISVGY